MKELVKVATVGRNSGSDFALGLVLDDDDTAAARVSARAAATDMLKRARAMAVAFIMTCPERRRDNANVKRIHLEAPAPAAVLLVAVRRRCLQVAQSVHRAGPFAPVAGSARPQHWQSLSPGQWGCGDRSCSEDVGDAINMAVVGA